MVTDFQLLSLIGRGGYGEVYLCRKLDTKEILVLKRMKKAQFTANKNEVCFIYESCQLFCFDLIRFGFFIFYNNYFGLFSRLFLAPTCTT
jgi:serine/threonine protein kinase